MEATIMVQAKESAIQLIQEMPDTVQLGDIIKTLQFAEHDLLKKNEAFDELERLKRLRKPGRETYDYKTEIAATLEERYDDAEINDAHTESEDEQIFQKLRGCISRIKMTAEEARDERLSCLHED